MPGRDIGSTESLVAPRTSRGLSEVGAHDMPSHIHPLQLLVTISPVAADNVLLVSGKTMDLSEVFAHIPVPSGSQSVATSKPPLASVRVYVRW